MDDSLRELCDENGFDQVVAARLAVIYKHSERCYACRRSLLEIQRFAAERSDVPVYMLDVIGRRDLAAHIARRLDIRHESPQAILLMGGTPVWHGSHFSVRADALTEAVDRLTQPD